MSEMISVKEARRHYPSARSGAHGFDHALRVTALAERIAREEGADLAIVRAAALLHDVAAAGPDRENHHRAGAAEARRILLGLGQPAARVEAVAHCVETHRFRKPAEAPETLEAQCVYDADKLDAIGAVGVARAFVYGAEHGQALWGNVSPAFRAGQETGEPHTPHHEFHCKLVHIRDRLYTETGRRIAAGRHRAMVDFFARMAGEVAGEA